MRAARRAALAAALLAGLARTAAAQAAAGAGAAPAASLAEPAGAAPALVPEPASLAVVGAALVGLGLWRRRPPVRRPGFRTRRFRGLA